VRANRSTQAGVCVLSNAEVIQQGRELARCLWNYMRHCLVGNSFYLARIRGDIPRRGSLGSYPGKFTIQKGLQDYPAYRDLADRCASYTVADFDIAMRSWFSNLRSNPRARPPRRCEEPRTLTFEVGRNAKHLLDKTFRLTVLGGHIAERHAFIRLILPDGVKTSDIKLIRIKPDGSAVCCIYKQFAQSPGEHVAALDMGVVNIGCLAFDDGESILYNGRGLLSEYFYEQGRAARCKPSGWKGKGEQNSRMSTRKRSYLHKATGTRKLALHNVTHHMIDQCKKHEVGILVLGNLKSLANMNDTLSQWLRGEMACQLQYKGEEAGIKIVTISEAWTSQTCARCGKLGKREPRGMLSCLHCGAVWNSDLNGAVNILNRYRLGDLGVGGDFPAPPSLAEPASGIGEVFAQMHPSFAAKCDLRTDCSIIMHPTGYRRLDLRKCSAVATRLL